MNLEVSKKTVSHFHPSPIFMGKTRAKPNEATYRTPLLEAALPEAFYSSN
jgi:hypothetical protein